MFDSFGQTRYQCPKCHTLFTHAVSFCHICRTHFHGTRKVAKLAPDPLEVRARENRQAAEEAARRDGIKTARRTARECELCGRPLRFLARLLGRAAHGNCREFTEPPPPPPPVPKPAAPPEVEATAIKPPLPPAPEPTARRGPKCPVCGSFDLYGDRYNICCRSCGMRRDKGSFRW